MRSFDRAMPEERNRVLTDHLSELLLCSSDTAAENLRERVDLRPGGGRGRRDGRCRDALAAGSARKTPRSLAGYGLMPGAYLLLTAHRAGNVDDPERLRALVD